MSSTFVAGAKLRAIDMVPQKIWTVSDTGDSTALTTTEAVISGFGTAPASTYRAGRAYKIIIRFRAQALGGAQDAFIQIRDTNASGTVRMSTVHLPRLPALSLSQGFYYEHMVANTTGSDITSRVLVLTGDTSTNTWFCDGGASHPSYWACYEMGASADFPEAFAL